MGKNSCVFNIGCFHSMARMCLSARSSNYWRGQKRSAPSIKALEECRCIALLANHMSLRLLQERCTATLWEPFQPNRSREKTNHRRDCRRHTQSRCPFGRKAYSQINIEPLLFSESSQKTR